MTTPLLSPSHGDPSRSEPSRSEQDGGGVARRLSGWHLRNLFRARRGGAAAMDDSERGGSFGGNVPARIVSGFLLLAVLVFWLGTNWLVPLNCRAQPISFSFGSEATSSIVVRSGKSCTILVKVGSIAIDELKVEQPPSNGVIIPRGSSGMVYQPFASFKGEDAFAVEFKGHSAFDSGSSSLRVTAVVR